MANKALAKERNRMQAKIDWLFRIDDARIKLKALYPAISEWRFYKCKINKANHPSIM